MIELLTKSIRMDCFVSANASSSFDLVMEDMVEIVRRGCCDMVNE